MNAHLPQSEAAATELREIAAVPKQLISPRLSKPLVSVVQDTLVGVNRLTRPTEFFSRREFMNLLVHSKRWDGRIPPPAKTDPVPLWSGLQVVSALLPAVYLEMGNKMWDESKGKGDPNYVIIHNGVIKQGILDGDIFDKALIHILYNDFGPEVTVDFLDSLQAVVAAYLQNSGFSVGLSDLIADTDTLSVIDADIATLKKQIETLQLQVHTGMFDNTTGRTNQEEFEMKVFETLNKAISAAGKTGLRSLIAANRMVNMVRCGSKGSDLNIAQMIALLGQQSIEGKRIAYGFQDRTLPHFKRYDDGAAARGFIESSFVKGMTPVEFFFHAMTGREGLIDTAVKSVTGDTLIRIKDAVNGWQTIAIGKWIDDLLAAADPATVEHHDEAHLELLDIAECGVSIQTADGAGTVSVAAITAVTRHDAGAEIFTIETNVGRRVTVSANKSLLVLDAGMARWVEKAPAEVTVGSVVPFITGDDDFVSHAEITAIVRQDVSDDPSMKLYDLTVPSTLNFALANGLVVRDTADSGYIQRQLVKTLEDQMVHHDSTVRDAGGLIVQFAYGDDGTSATKIENQPISLGKMTDTEIRERFAVPDVASDKSQAFLDMVFRDREMLVRKVWGGKVEGSVQAAVHLRRLIGDTIQQLALAPGKGEPVPGAHVLDTIQRIHARTRPDNALWGALLRFNLNPRELQERGFTRAAFDWMAEQIVIRHMKTWVTPGEMVGIIAAQSIGEPTTQLTLNSVDWDTGIIIARDGKIWTPQIGEFIDNYIATCDPARIQELPNKQLYVSLEGDGHDWKAISCDETGKMMWTKLEAITRHPVVNADGTNTILEVELESGRVVKATKARSFLRYEDGVIVPCNGSDLRIGDKLPIANNLVIGELPVIATLELRGILPATEWLYGTDVKLALAAMHDADAAGVRRWYTHANGTAFTVPYVRSDSFRVAFGGDTPLAFAAHIQEGKVYPKKVGKEIAQIPESIPLNREFGFFCGAYLSEGMSNSTQVNITNNDLRFLTPIQKLMESWSVGTHIVSEDRVAKKTGITGHSQSIIIHSTLLAKLMQKQFGRVSYEKKIPDWVFQAPDEFVAGVVDGYVSGDGTVSSDNVLTVTSVSEKLIDGMAIIFSRFGLFGTRSSYMPELRKFDSVSRSYKLSILPKYTYKFAELFELTMQHKQDRLSLLRIIGREPRCFREECGETVLDKVRSIKEVTPIKEWVYDITVEETRNFTCSNLLLGRDTFHLSGVAAKSGMTRGVPRIKELFKVSQNPRATSLTVYLRPDIRKSKEEARRLAQELEFTMLRDLVVKSRIYFDPRDSATLIAEDKEWLTFFSMFEQAAAGSSSASSSSSASTTESTTDSTEEDARSPWIVRLEMDREKMFAKNITMDDIAFVIRNATEGAVKTTYTDHNASRMIFRIRLIMDDKQLAKEKPIDDLAMVKLTQNKLLTQTLVRGLPGLKTVTFRKVTNEVFERNPDKDGKFEPVEEFVLDTLGTNFLDVMIHPDVDGTRLISNHVHDIAENLGIEAARKVLFREIYTLFAEAAPVNYRHIALLADAMTNRGRLMSADRFGTQKKKIGPLAKASFEQAEDIMLKAALFGELDPVTGVSANIMTGQPIRGGTTFTQILLDEAALADLIATAPPPRRIIERAPELMQDQIDAILEAPEKPGCRTEEIRIPTALPPMDPVVTAAELPEIDIVISDD